MSRPRLLMLDEPSLGLAPVLVDVVFELFGLPSGLGADPARRRAERHEDAWRPPTGPMCCARGEVVAEGTGEELRQRDDLFATFIGG